MSRTASKNAGSTRKSHKSRKTAPDKASAGGPSSTKLAATTPALPSENDITDVLMVTDKPSGEEKKGSNYVGTGAPVEAPPEKQWWFRSVDSKAKTQADKIVVMRAAGHKDAEIAKRLKTTDTNVRNIMWLARKNGWLDEDDEPVDIELEAALNLDRKVVRNISASLDGGMTNWQTHEMTIAAAKGRGIFKNHDVVKNEGGQLTAMVAIKIVMPTVGVEDQSIDEAAVGGTPAYLEGEVADDQVHEAQREGS